jgi:hypothetical protein
MRNLPLLKKAVQIVTFLFAALSGFLTAAPPGMNQFAIGMASFLALASLLVVSALASRRPKMRRWRYWLGATLVLIVAGFTFGVYYDAALSRLTFMATIRGETETLIAGCEPTPFARDKFAAGYSAEELVRNIGGLPRINDVWSAESQICARRRLLVAYSGLVLAVASAVFCALELATARRAVRQSGAVPKA